MQVTKSCVVFPKHSAERNSPAAHERQGTHEGHAGSPEADPFGVLKKVPRGQGRGSGQQEPSEVHAEGHEAKSEPHSAAWEVEGGGFSGLEVGWVRGEDGGRVGRYRGAADEGNGPRSELHFDLREVERKSAEANEERGVSKVKVTFYVFVVEREGFCRSVVRRP